MNLREFWIIARDVLLVLTGIGGIVHQELGPASEVSEALLLAYAGLIGVPGAIGLFQLRGSTAGGGATNSGSPSPSPEPSPSQQPSSPSSSA